MLYLLLTIVTLLLCALIILDNKMSRRMTDKLIDETREQLMLERESDELLRYFIDSNELYAQGNPDAFYKEIN